MKQNLSRVKQPQKFDFILITIIALMAIASFIAIYAATPLIPSYLGTTGITGVLGKQILFYALGFVIIGIIMFVGNDNLFDLAKLGYFIFLGLLIYLFIDLQVAQRIKIGATGIESVLPFAKTVNGATAWLEFPVFGTLQPAEFMKIMLIIISAYIIHEHNEEKTEDSFESDFQLFGKLAKWIIPPSILILLQPDTGIFLIIIVTILIMVICSGIRKEWIIIGFSIAGIAIAIFFFLYFFTPSIFVKIFNPRNYKVARIYGWLEPEQYSLTHGLQLYTSLLSMGSGGFLGHGLQAAVISIPEAHTDFIFAIIGMNFGFLGCIIVLGLCFALDVRLYQIASRNKNNVEKLMVIGFLGLFIIQQLENIGMVLGVFPITGITLPLISAGGSSLLSYMIAFGIIMNASSRAKKLSDFVY